MFYVPHRRRQLMMPKISPIGHTALATQSEPAQQNNRKKTLESTGVVPAKYSSKVKLELFSQL